MSASNIDSVNFRDIIDYFIFEFFMYFRQFVYTFPYCFVVVIFSQKIQMLLLSLFLDLSLNPIG